MFTTRFCSFFFFRIRISQNSLSVQLLLFDFQKIIFEATNQDETFPLVTLPKLFVAFMTDPAPKKNVKKRDFLKLQVALKMSI